MSHSVHMMDTSSVDDSDDDEDMDVEASIKTAPASLAASLSRQLSDFDSQSSQQPFHMSSSQQSGGGRKQANELLGMWS